MTITTSDVLQSFLTAIKDLHSTILHMILKLLFQELRIEKKYWYSLLWCSSHGERLRILDLIFPPIFLVNKTMQRISHKSQLTSESSKRNCLCQKMGHICVFETHCLKRRHASRRPSQLDFKTN